MEKKDWFGDLSSLIGFAEALDILHDPRLASDGKSQKVRVLSCGKSLAHPKGSSFI